MAFAESWRRCKEGLAETAEASEAEVDSARKSVERETGDDREAQEQEATAAGVVGAWLKHAAPDMQSQMKELQKKIDALLAEDEELTGLKKKIQTIAPEIPTMPRRSAPPPPPSGAQK